jgi:hypothetical protein
MQESFIHESGNERAQKSRSTIDTSNPGILVLTPRTCMTLHSRVVFKAIMSISYEALCLG